MAIYGVGAYFTDDISKDCINNNLIGIGWDVTEAPEQHEFFSSLKAGGIVYIKSCPIGQDITVKAIGIIRDNCIINNITIGNNTLITIGRNVKWLNLDIFTIPKPFEKNNVRSNAIYEEFHPEVINEIILKL